MKKTLAILLSLALVICMIPATASVAFAGELAESSITLNPATATYDGSSKKPAVTVSGATESTDYTLVWTKDGKPVSDIIEAGTYTVTVTGKSYSCTGSATKSFTVSEANISGATITLEKDTVTYNGKAHTPAVKSVVLSGKTLVPGTDYTVGYSDNTAGGTATVTVTGQGNYTGTETKTFTISPFVLDATEDGRKVVTVDVGSQVEGLTGKNPQGFKWENVDFYINGVQNNSFLNKDNLNVEITGTTAKFTGQVEGSISENVSGTFQTMPDINASVTATIGTVSAYDGTAKTINVSFARKGSYSGTLPTKDDYTIQCDDKVNAGTRKVTIVGKNNFAGSTTATLTIPKRSANNVVIEDIPNQIVGTNPTVKVKDTINGQEVTLSAGTHYLLSFSNPINGVATATLDFDKIINGNYTGTRTKTYKVISSGNYIEASDVTVNSGVAYKPYYSGYTQKPTVIVNVLGYGSGLVEGRDYTVSYIYTDAKGKEHSTPSPVDAYRYKVKVTGIGNYAGEVVVDNMFEIQKHPFSKSYLNITVAQGNTTQLPSVTVRSIDNRITFKAGTDYTVGTPVINSYTGKATVTISSTGTGNLASGTITETYAVNGKNIAYCSVEFATGSKQSYQYTGSVIKPQVKVRDGYTTLTEGTDYTVTYKDAAGKVVYSPKDAGTYTIVIEGKGLYSGTTTMTFYIVGTDISGYTVTLKESSVNATGYAQTPVITSVKKGVYSSLTSNDYTVTYQDATGKTVTSMSAPGTYKVVVTGKNGYSGSTYATFRIVGLPQTVTANQDSYKVYTTSDSFKITAKATGDGTGFTYTSSNPAVASVSATGYVTIHKVGKAVITVTTTGNKKYEPTSKDVTVKVYPSKTKISQKPSTDGKKAQMKVRWGYQDGVTKYQIRYSRDKNFKSGSYLTKTVKAHGKSYTTQSTTISNLKSGYTYYFKVRAVYTDPYTGDTYYGSWSPWRSAKTK
ncbi:MAG: Ig domain-containing protein [Anaerovoracaceae bacterium]